VDNGHQINGDSYSALLHRLTGNTSYFLNYECLVAFEIPWSCAWHPVQARVGLVPQLLFPCMSLRHPRDVALDLYV